MAVLLVVAAVTALPAQRARTRTVTDVACAADLGTGVESERQFCDVLIGTLPADSISLAVPEHTGNATLLFDLHNRFTIPTAVSPAVLAYARHEALVTVVDGLGAVLGKGAVVEEFRTVKDLFDRIGGGTRPGGVKAVAPGKPASVRVTVPAGVDTVGIIGSRLTVLTRAGGTQTFDTPGRPVAMASNIRLQYRP